MRTILLKGASVAVIAVMLLSVASLARAEISVNGSLNGSVSSGYDDKGSSADASANANANVQGDSSSGKDNASGDDSSVKVDAGAALDGAVSSLNVKRSESGADAAVMSVGSVSADSDLNAFAKGVIASDTNVSEVAATDNEVSIWYKVPGKFLGIFPVVMDARVSADASGNAAVDYPWYGFLTSVNDGSGNASLKSTVSSAVGPSVGANASANAKFSAQAKAALISALHNALRNWTQARVSGSASADAQGTASY